MTIRMKSLQAIFKIGIIKPDVNYGNYLYPGHNRQYIILLNIVSRIRGTVNKPNGKSSSFDAFVANFLHTYSSNQPRPQIQFINKLLTMKSKTSKSRDNHKGFFHKYDKDMMSRYLMKYKICDTDGATPFDVDDILGESSGHAAGQPGDNVLLSKNFTLVNAQRTEHRALELLRDVMAEIGRRRKLK